jgi:hypothetical protein
MDHSPLLTAVAVSSVIFPAFINRRTPGPPRLCAVDTQLRMRGTLAATQAMPAKLRIVPRGLGRATDSQSIGLCRMGVYVSRGSRDTTARRRLKAHVNPAAICAGMIQAQISFFDVPTTPLV